MDGDILCDDYRPSGGEIPLDLCLQMGLLDAVGGTCTASRGSGGIIAVRIAVLRILVSDDRPLSACGMHTLFKCYPRLRWYLQWFIWCELVWLGRGLRTPSMSGRLPGNTCGMQTFKPSLGYYTIQS